MARGKWKSSKRKAMRSSGGRRRTGEQARKDNAYMNGAKVTVSGYNALCRKIVGPAGPQRRMASRVVCGNRRKIEARVAARQKRAGKRAGKRAA